MSCEWIFNKKSYFDETRNRFIPSFRYLVSFTDPADERNFYRYRTPTWEKLDVCKSCNFQQAFYDTFGACITTNRARFVFQYDYPCASDCWG